MQTAPHQTATRCDVGRFSYDFCDSWFVKCYFCAVHTQLSHRFVPIIMYDVGLYLSTYKRYTKIPLQQAVNYYERSFLPQVEGLRCGFSLGFAVWKHRVCGSWCGWRLYNASAARFGASSCGAVIKDGAQGLDCVPGHISITEHGKFGE